MRKYPRKRHQPGVFLLALLLMTGCSVAAQDGSATNDGGETITGEGSSQRFRVKLSLTSPDDLKVREGDTIVAGQILADKARERSRLQFQKDGLIREIARLRKLAELPIPDIKSLPDANYDQEAAAIEAARHKAEMAAKAKEQQQRKLDVLQGLEPGEVPPAVIPHEVIVLEEKERLFNQAQADVDLEKGKLARAREKRKLDEYAYSLETSKRNIAIREHELKTQGTIADLEAKLSQVDVSLSQLSAVRSPYSGRVQRIKFEGQTDTSLSVELALVVDRGSFPGSASPQTPSPSPTSQATPQVRSSPRSSTSKN